MIDDDLLVKKAIAISGLAYAPYSHFPVGAALLGESGTVYTACNVENASYGLSLCAERGAVMRAVASGERKFRRIVISGNSSDFCCPCGACRQVLSEFSPDMEVWCLNRDREILKTTLSELLPHNFGPQNLE